MDYKRSLLLFKLVSPAKPLLPLKLHIWIPGQWVQFTSGLNSGVSATWAMQVASFLLPLWTPSRQSQCFWASSHSCTLLRSFCANTLPVPGACLPECCLTFSSHCTGRAINLFIVLWPVLRQSFWQESGLKHCRWLANTHLQIFPYLNSLISLFFCHPERKEGSTPGSGNAMGVGWKEYWELEDGRNSGKRCLLGMPSLPRINIPDLTAAVIPCSWTAQDGVHQQSWSSTVPCGASGG